MLQILNSGMVENDDQLIQLVGCYGQLIIPSDNDDLDLTHWWAINEDGAEILYVGTPDTFGTYVKERNGGLR